MKKRNLLVVGLISVFGLSSCIKGDNFDPNEQFELEKPIVEAYAKTHLMAPTLHENTGIWYEVVQPGDPESYQYKASESTSNPGTLIPVFPEVLAAYEGRLVSNNQVFDSGEEAKFIIAQGQGGVIAAWQAAFFPEEILFDEEGELLEEPFAFGGLTPDGLKVGSIIKIVTPSYWAYGNANSGSIPANSPLYFEIEVLEIEDYDSSAN